MVKPRLTRRGDAVERAARPRAERAQPDGELARLRARCEELTRRLEAAERSQKELLSVVSHDLRNPLSVILVSNRLLMRGTPEDAKERRQLDAIARAADEINQLVSDLNDAVSIEGGTFGVGPEERVEAKAVVDKALRGLAPVAAQKPLSLEVELPPSLPALSGDGDRLVQVFSHLVGHSMKFTPRGGAISVRGKAAPRGVVFSISDNGPGLNDEQRARAFSYPLGERRPMSQGSGLGVYVAKGIVEAHGGRLWLESEPGKGLTFFFTLPASSSSKESLKESSKESREPSREPTRRTP